MPRNRAGGDGEWCGVRMHEEMHKFKWVSVKCVVRVGVCLFFVKECCFRVRVCDKKLSITRKTPPSGRWGSNNHETIFVGEWEWKLFRYSFISMLIMAF